MGLALRSLGVPAHSVRKALGLYLVLGQTVHQLPNLQTKDDGRASGVLGPARTCL